jgi:hypothetical protein
LNQVFQLKKSRLFIQIKGNKMEFDKDLRSSLISIPEQLVSILGVVYTHHKTGDGGDLYLTQYGLPFSNLLETENWYEKEWFESHRERLEGTSAVYKVRTKEIDGQSLELVVKNSRVGEDVPLDTHKLMEFMNTEFNSPWEEFSMVFEMREGKFGPEDISIKTQYPLAIYVPPEKMQLWQSGRSLYKVNSIINRHPGIYIDIFKQYKMIYGWIKGKDVTEVFKDIGINGRELEMNLLPITEKAITDLEKKGYAVADMKPTHIIIDEENINKLDLLDDKSDLKKKECGFIANLISNGDYSIVDYELLIRTPQYDEYVKNMRRHTYLDDQKDRFISSELPSFLSEASIFDVPYIHGRVESTGGLLWVVGKNPRLFDYFLPERWRKTHHWKLSINNDIFYTVTKDNIHMVWKTSRIGEMPSGLPGDKRSAVMKEYGFNSPFEEFAIAFDLNNNGVPTVYIRAIYMTGSIKQEHSEDMGHFGSHDAFLSIEGQPVLNENHNYITIRGYYNGPDEWVAVQKGQLCRPVDLKKAVHNAIFTVQEADKMRDRLISKMRNLGYDGTLLEINDMLVSINPENEILKDADGYPELRITNFEFIRKI